MFALRIKFEDKCKMGRNNTNAITKELKTELFKVAGSLITFKTKELAEKFLDSNFRVSTDPNWLNGLKKNNVLKVLQTEIIAL